MAIFLGLVLAASPGCKLDRDGGNAASGVSPLPALDGAVIFAPEDAEAGLAEDDEGMMERPSQDVDVFSQDVHFVPQDGDSPPQEWDSSATPFCEGNGRLKYAGHCYVLLAESLTQAVAVEQCKNQGTNAHLVTLTSAAEADGIATLGASSDVWLGLSKTGAAWNWVTGESFSYHAWDADEPNGSGLCARRYTNGKWRDYDCATRFGVICEHE